MWSPILMSSPLSTSTSNPFPSNERYLIRYELITLIHFRLLTLRHVSLEKHYRLLPSIGETTSPSVGLIPKPSPIIFAQTLDQEYLQF